MNKVIPAILDAFAEKTGIALPASRLSDATRVVSRALSELGITARGVATGRAALGNNALFERLVEHLTVRETYFFRDNMQFTELRERILPEWRTRHGTDSILRAWSAGCASGEEAYSLAMIFEQEKIHAATIATDICKLALAQGQRGIYDRWSLRGEGKRALEFCDSSDVPFTMPDRLRSRIQFKYLNLAEDNYPSEVSGISDLDVIICRNVLMYFDEPTIQRIARRFHSSLAPTGWLIMGPSDPPLWDYAAFEPIITQAGVLYRRKAARSLKVPAKLPERAAPSPSNIETKPAGAKLPKQIEVSPRTLAPTDSPSQESLSAQILRIRASADSGDLSTAIETANAMLAKHPAAVEIHYVRAIALLAAGQNRDSLDALRRVIYLDRTLAVAHLVMATLLERTGETADASRAYAKVAILCESLPPDMVLPLSDGETAGQLTAAARDGLSRLQRQHMKIVANG